MSIKSHTIYTVILGLGLACLTHTSHAGVADLGLFYKQSKSRASQLQPRLLFRGRTNHLIVSGGLALSLSNPRLQSVAYTLQADREFFSFLSLGTRLNHIISVENQYGTTQFQFQLNTYYLVLDWLELYATFGYYFSWTELESPTVWPIPLGGNFSDQHFVAEAGALFKPKEGLEIEAGFGTYEEFETYRLNNPFIQTKVSFQHDKQAAKLSLYFRYKLLLGFGRLNEFTTGFLVSTDWGGFKPPPK